MSYFNDEDRHLDKITKVASVYDDFQMQYDHCTPGTMVTQIMKLGFTDLLFPNDDLRRIYHSSEYMYN